MVEGNGAGEGSRGQWWKLGWVDVSISLGKFPSGGPNYAGGWRKVGSVANGSGAIELIIT